MIVEDRFKRYLQSKGYQKVDNTNVYWCKGKIRIYITKKGIFIRVIISPAKILLSHYIKWSRSEQDLVIKINKLEDIIGYFNFI